MHAARYIYLSTLECFMLIVYSYNIYAYRCIIIVYGVFIVVAVAVAVAVAANWDILWFVDIVKEAIAWALFDLYVGALQVWIVSFEWSHYCI